MPSTECLSQLRRTQLPCAGSFQHSHLDVQTRGRDHVDQGIEGEKIDLAAHQIRDPGLRHAQELSGLNLAQLGSGDMTLERQRARGSGLKYEPLPTRGQLY